MTARRTTELRTDLTLVAEHITPGSGCWIWAAAPDPCCTI